MKSIQDRLHQEHDHQCAEHLHQDHGLHQDDHFVNLANINLQDKYALFQPQEEYVFPIGLHHDN